MCSKGLFRCLGALSILGLFASPATAYECSPGKAAFEAGPIWDNEDAQGKCPQVCEKNDGTWDGGWWTTVWGKMSVCECSTCCGNLEAGPIWNQEDAAKKCPATCGKAGGVWNGQWWTTVEGKMSVCQCCGNCCKHETKAIEAGPIWDNNDAQRKCPATCDKAGGKWDGGWWTTVQGKMSVCQCVSCASAGK